MGVWRLPLTRTDVCSYTQGNWQYLRPRRYDPSVAVGAESTMTVADEPLVAADLILLLLNAPSPGGAAEDVRGITRLEKLLFLVDKQTDLSTRVLRPFEFKPYNYGPYSKAIYEAIDVLEEARLVSEERVFFADDVAIDEMEDATASDTELEGTERRFSLTDEGRDVARLLADRNPDVAPILANIKKQYAAMPLRQLIRYVYLQYPTYAEASLIRDRV